MGDDNIKCWESEAIGLLLHKEASLVGVDLTPAQVKCFIAYGRLLAQGNKKLNLSTISDPREVVRKHFADSLAAAPYLPADASSLADVGTGAGLPGLALKIVRPKIDLTLIDSVQKKARFVSDTVRNLSFSSVRVVARRAEELGHDAGFRGQFDVVTARAVAALPVLLELCLPLVKVGGLVVAYKGPGAQDELSASGRSLDELGGGAPELVYLELGGREQRSLVLIKKIRPTPDQYPRAPGRPAKRPL